MSLLVAEYCETLDTIAKAKEEGTLTPAVEDMMSDRLDEIWNECTVDEIREIEERYPELRLRRFG